MATWQGRHTWLPTKIAAANISISSILSLRRMSLPRTPTEDR